MSLISNKGSFIQSLINEGVLAGYWDFREKHIQDLSGNSNNGVHTDTLWSGSGLRFLQSTSLITISDSASLQLTTGAIMIFGEFNNQGTATLVCKADAGGTNYVLASTSSTLTIDDGSNVRTINVDITNKTSIGINLPTAGGTCECFVDGVSAGSFSGTSTFTVDDADLVIGNLYSGSNNFTNIIHGVLILSRVLTSTEWAKIQEEFSNKFLPTETEAITNSAINIKPDEEDLVGAWEMVPISNLLVDQSSYSNDLTIVRAGHQKDLLGDALTFDGANNYCSCTVSNFGSGDSAGLVEVWFSVDSIVSARTILCTADTASANYFLTMYVDTSGKLVIEQKENDVNDVISTTNSVVVGIKNHAVFMSTGGSYKIYLNGHEETLSVDAGSNSGDWFLDTTNRDNLVIGARILNTTDRYFSGKIYNLRIFNVAKGDYWVLDQYNKGKYAKWNLDFGAFESISNTTSGRLENTPFYVSSGTFKVSMDTINNTLAKVVECVNDGICYIDTGHFSQSPTEAAYGTWEWWVYHLDASTTDIGFATASPNITAGYGVTIASNESVKIVEYGVGDVTALGGSISASIWTKIKVTRTESGLFILYINDSLIDSGTDTTTTSANYFTISFDAGDKIIYSDMKAQYTLSKKLFV